MLRINTTGLLSEGSHAVCLMDNVPFLNLSVPCLFRDGVPKAFITGLRATKNGENTCLSIDWEFYGKSSQVGTWEVYCMDQLTKTSQILNSTEAFTAELCYQTPSEWVYCCVAVNSILQNSSVRSCDCQHIAVAQPPQLKVNGITAQRINNSICIEFDWEFTEHQVINAGVCCAPHHMLFHQSCYKKDVPCHVNIITLSWCGTFGHGNYILYCYAFNDYKTNDGVRTVQSRIYSSPIDGPQVQDISYSFTSSKDQRCFVVHYTIPKSFHSLQEINLCCGTNHCENKTVETMADFKNWNHLRMNITHCESANNSDISMDCELKNIFDPNMIVSNSVSITEPVRLLVDGFLHAERSAAWVRNRNEDRMKEVCFKLKIIATGKVDNQSVSECCAKAVSSEQYCVETGNLLCIESAKIEPTAYCYAKVNQATPEISNIVEKNLGKPSIYAINITTASNHRLYTLLFLKDPLDRNFHSSSKVPEWWVYKKNHIKIL